MEHHTIHPSTPHINSNIRGTFLPGTTWMTEGGRGEIKAERELKLLTRKEGGE